MHRLIPDGYDLTHNDDFKHLDYTGYYLRHRSYIRIRFALVGTRL